LLIVSTISRRLRVERASRSSGLCFTRRKVGAFLCWMG